MTKKTINMIVAISGKERVMGKNGSIPWHAPEDMAFFKEKTEGTTVIMGRKTWESLPNKYRPLPNRVNIVLTSNTDFNAPKALVAHSKEEAIGLAEKETSENVFIIGGSKIYEMFLPETQKLYVSLIKENFEGDTYFPEYTKDFILKKEMSSEKVVFQEFLRK